MSGLACLLVLGCRTPLAARREGVPESAQRSRSAHVDLERVRRDAAVGATDAADVELAIRLLAHAVAQAHNYVLVEGEGADITEAVITAFARAPVASMPWLVGAWRGESDGATTTERWCPGADGTLHGYNTTEHGGEQVAFEWLTIALQPAGLVYLAQPQGRTPATPFADANDTTPVAARFENPDNEFPARLQYTRDGAALRVVATGGEQKLEWTWQRTAQDVAAMAKVCASIRTRTHPPK